MDWVADANIYLRRINVNSTFYVETKQAIETIEQRGDRLVLIPQNLFEMWNVLARPLANNGFGLAVADALTVIDDMQSKHWLLLDKPETLRQWRRLVEGYEVKGVQVHDARIVAACLSHGITHLMTYNVTDFQRYASELTVVHPKDV